MSLALPGAVAGINGCVAGSCQAREHHWSHDLCRVYTRPAYTKLIIDLAGLSAIEDPRAVRILEPGAGGGAFAVPIALRLLSAARACGIAPGELDRTIRAVEVDLAATALMRRRLYHLLHRFQVRRRTADNLVGAWVREEDFLCYDEPLTFTHAVGNPPYIRWSNLPPELRPALKKGSPTFRARPDIYILFLERCLDRLGVEGSMTMISPSNWLVKRFGAELRERLDAQGSIDRVVFLDRCRPFVDNVRLHPLVFRFRRGARHAPGFVIPASPSAPPRASSHATCSIPGGMPILDGRAPALLVRGDVFSAQAKLVARFPTLAEAGITIRVGSTTGCNDVFLARSGATPPIEACRLRPFLTGRQLRNGGIAWNGTYVINMFDRRGRIVDRKAFPKLWAYIEQRRAALDRRSSASKGWFRTIDILHEKWLAPGKILVRDIGRAPCLALDRTGYCAGNTLYQLRSIDWPVNVLHAILSAGLVGLGVASSSTPTLSGYYRYQTQFLNQVRVPRWADLPDRQRADLCAAAARADRAAVFAFNADILGVDEELLLQHAADGWGRRCA